MKENENTVDETLLQLSKQIEDNNRMFEQNIKELYEKSNILDSTDYPVGNNFIKRKVKQSIVNTMTPYIESQNSLNHLMGNLCQDLERISELLTKQSFVQSQKELGIAAEMLCSMIAKAEESRMDYSSFIQFRNMIGNPLFEEKRETPCIIQIVSEVKFGDAVGNDVMAINDVLKDEGYLTGVFVAKFNRKYNLHDVYHINMLMDLREDDIVIYHLASHDPLAELIKSLQCKVVLRYHNVTPPEFFEPYDEKSAELTRKGLEQVEEIKEYIDFGMVVSDFNKNDLIDMGYSCPIDVVPIVIPFEDYKQNPDSRVIGKYSDGITNLLFLGRGAPNKKIEDIITAFDVYKKKYNAKARLFLVGNYEVGAKYTYYINDTIERLGVKDVIFPGHISFAEILAYYSVADIFLCMSEHEGFCVPLLEAMSFDLPILAYDSAAVPGTLGGAGELFKEKKYDVVADRIDEIVTNKTYRTELIIGQRKRLQDFQYDVVRQQILECIRKYK